MPPSPSIEETRNDAINKAYIEIKSRAWAGVLKSSQIADRLSTAARERLYAEFDEVKKLEFDIPNILGFIQGVISQQGQIQIEMLMDVFDLFTKYRTDNRCYYQGWKSNDKHRTCAYRLKMSRMVLPSTDRSGYSWRSCVSWNDTQLFQDIDRVFALLDGKHHSAIQGLASLFSTDATFKQLCQGERLSSDYFDVRFYPGTGTFHFFPRRADLIDRLNRAIGKHRNWLPHEEGEASRRSGLSTIKPRRSPTGSPPKNRLAAPAARRTRRATTRGRQAPRCPCGLTRRMRAHPLGAGITSPLAS